MKQEERASRPAEVLDEVFGKREIIDSLYQTPQKKHELAGKIGVSSKTVYRRTRELEELQLVKRDDTGYCLTGLGYIHATMLRYIKNISGSLCEVNELLNDVSSDALPPFQIFSNADIVCSEPHAPNKPLELVESFVCDTQRVKGISPVLLPKYVELFHDEVVSSGLVLELVLTEAVASHLKSEYNKRLDRATDSGATILATSADVSLGLLISKSPSRELLLLMYDSRNRLNGAVRTDDPVGLDWAETIYRNYRMDATPL